MEEIKKKMSNLSNFKKLNNRVSNKITEIKKTMNPKVQNIMNLLCNISNKLSENKNIKEIKLSKFKRDFLIDYSLNQTLIFQPSIEDDDFYFNKNIIMSKEEIDELRKNLLGNKTNRINNENPIISNEKNKNLVSYKNGKIKIQQEEEEDKKIENNNDLIKLNYNVIFIYSFYRCYQ